MVQHFEDGVLSVLVLLVLENLLDSNLLTGEAVDSEVDNPEGAFPGDPLDLVLGSRHLGLVTFPLAETGRRCGGFMLGIEGLRLCFKVLLVVNNFMLGNFVAGPVGLLLLEGIFVDIFGVDIDKSWLADDPLCFFAVLVEKVGGRHWLYLGNDSSMVQIF